MSSGSSTHDTYAETKRISASLSLNSLTGFAFQKGRKRSFAPGKVINSHSSHATPEPPRRLLHLPLLRPNHLLRLPPRIPPTINLHLIPSPIHPSLPVPIPIPIPLRPPALLPPRIPAKRSIHQPRRATLPQLINGSNRINRRMQRPPRVEILFNRRQQIRRRAAGFRIRCVGGRIRSGFYDEGVRECLV